MLQITVFYVSLSPLRKAKKDVFEMKAPTKFIPLLPYRSNDDMKLAHRTYNLM
jgi:hypothetical protein